MAAITLSRLIELKDQVQLFFRRPAVDSSLAQQKSWSDNWKANFPGIEATVPYLWGGTNIVGVGYRWPASPGIEILLASEKPSLPAANPLKDLRTLLETVFPTEFPEVPLNLVVTGSFKARGGATIGAGITLNGSTTSGDGMLAVIVKNSAPAPTFYAVTCAHVLNGAFHSGVKVFVSGSSIGTLFDGIAPRIGTPSIPSKSDAVLVLLPALSPPQKYTDVLPPDKKTGVVAVVSTTDVAVTGQPASIVNQTKKTTGTVQGMYDVLIQYPTGKAFLPHLVGITGASVAIGDSGSICMSGANAVGMLVASSDKLLGAGTVAYTLVLDINDTLGQLAGLVPNPPLKLV